MKNQKGSITLYVLIGMLFFTMALIGTFTIVANRAKTQKQINQQVQDTYETGDPDSIYNSYIGGDIVPIYTVAQLLKIASGEQIVINEEGGKYYTFSDTATYVLRNDISIYAKDFDDGDAIWTEIKEKLDSLEGRFETAGHTITIIDTLGKKAVYPEDKVNSVPIPTGFTASNVPGEDTVDGGLVIIGPDGSEFVWVPVPNAYIDVQGMNDTQINTAINNEVNAGRYPMSIKTSSTDYKGVLYDFTGTSSVTITARTYATSSITNYREPDTITDYDNTASYYTNASITGITNSAQFKTQLQNEYNRMVTSIATNGGFFIARYETSLNDTMVQSKINVIPMASFNWYGMYQKQKSYNSNNKMASSMIWGSQWDQAMIWMKDVPNPGKSKPFYVLDSTGMGWYSDNIVHNTGTLPTAKVKNIYDMSGNVADWITENANTYYRIGCGR